MKLRQLKEEKNDNETRPRYPVYLHKDASDYGVGAYLFQLAKNTQFNSSADHFSE
jgi:hypothetical protein